MWCYLNIQPQQAILTIVKKKNCEKNLYTYSLALLMKMGREQDGNIKMFENSTLFKWVHKGTKYKHKV